MTAPAWRDRLVASTPQPLPQEPERPAVVPYALPLEAAGAYIGLSKRTMERLTQQGILPAVHAAGRRVIPRQALERYIDAQAEDGYAFRLPRSIAECRIAVAECERQVAELGAAADRTSDEAARDMLLLAARAYALLRRFYAWHAGLDEFAPVSLTRAS